MELSVLSEVVKEDGEWFVPKAVDGKPLDISFLCIGRNTEEYRRITHRNALKYASGRKGNLEEVVGSADLFIACVKDWKGITIDGKEYPCTKENKKSMYDNPRMKWLCEQIEAFIIEDANFLSVKEQ
jgi:hypothetical protein